MEGMEEEPKAGAGGEAANPPRDEEEEEEDDDDDEEDLEKLQAEIARMEEEAARITKETEELEKKKDQPGGAASGGDKPASVDGYEYWLFVCDLSSTRLIVGSTDWLLSHASKSFLFPFSIETPGTPSTWGRSTTRPRRRSCLSTSRRAGPLKGLPSFGASFKAN
jgi:hypothetical protein